MANLIFIDCETTGLKETSDHIVEIALLAVHIPTFTPVAHLSLVVCPPLWPTVKRNLNEKVLAMHTASGLIDEIEGPSAAPLAEVEARCLKFMSAYAPKTFAWESPMAGCNPDFDRRFLRARMPNLHARFHYRNWDVRAFTQLQEWVFGVKHVESPHRALPDVEKALADVRSFLGLDA